MSLPPLPASAIVLGADAETWRDAVRLVGGALAASGVAQPGYADEMIRMIEEHGPYVVIAPGLALAHARPGPEVLADGIAVVTLRTPVRFGHPYNDPVSVIVGLAIADSDRHLATIAAVANVFNDTSAIQDLAVASTPAEVQAVMGVSGATAPNGG